VRWQAIISAQIGDLDLAMVYLKDAFSKGMPFQEWYHNDPIYEPLWDFPEYKEFIKPKK